MSNTSALQQLVLDGLKKNSEDALILQMCDSCETLLAMIVILNPSVPEPLIRRLRINLQQLADATSIPFPRFAASQDTTPKSSGLAPDKDESDG